MKKPATSKTRSKDAKTKARGAKKSAKKKTAAKKKAPAKKPAARKAAPPAPKPSAPPPAGGPAEKALALITKSLDDDQADDIAVIHLAGKSAIADYMVVASGRNPRHIGAMAQHLREKIKATTGISPPVEGMASAEWVLVDQGDVVVHLFRPETRKLYNLEKMWGAEFGPEAEDADPRRV